MFNKVFNTAKRILSRSPSVQDVREEVKKAPPTSHGASDEMVTSTRRGPVTPQGSASKTKGKRELDAHDTPTVSKKRRTSIINEEDAAHKESTTADDEQNAVDTAEPTEALPLREKHQKEEDGEPRRSRRLRHSSPPSALEVAAEINQAATPMSSKEDAFYTPATHKKGSVFETPASVLPDKEGSVTPKAKPASSTKKSSGKRSQQAKAPEETPTARRSKASIPDEVPSSTWEGEETEEAISTQESKAGQEAETKKSHVRFGSEEPHQEEGAVSLDITAQQPVVEEEAHDDEEEDSDSDEAPEEITASSAITKVKAVEAEAAKAFKAQQERERARKQERAERMAEEQAQKRKRLEKRASEYAKVEARKQSYSKRTGLDIDASNLPALLPASLLEAAGDVRPPTPPAEIPGKSAEEIRKENLSRHIKFAEQSQKRVKDLKKGSLSVRVLDRQNGALAPKSNKNGKNVREQWLKGREQEKRNKGGKRKVDTRKMQRRPFGGSFLRDED
ncbi:hypothetical protein BU24DRAFT_421768 [Aaosphaeria arxii CBS 175.79]|uniref:Uncharacterized protein n=1 Tax=Aaosphaeria arxii CBS 175.79 TaxID=1450172 RepID=A0A6A5XT91_9PLEO|nr:uncharacterized protein BU24DRAFT_421768 [Aaosphaeria arxii CBS 175.79]KAF2015464.1 hypothetical protein BU24DRAFT_421768 [Aaosphaeria arxii CBS 175.79]